MKNGKAIIASIFILVSGATGAFACGANSSMYNPPDNYGYGYEYRGERRGNEGFYGPDRRDGSYRGEEGRYYYERRDNSDRTTRKNGFYGDDRGELNRDSRYTERQMRSRMMENDLRTDRAAPSDLRRDRETRMHEETRTDLNKADKTE